MTTKADFQKYHTLNRPGIIHGFDFPFSIEQLHSYGPAWLTKALHASGALADGLLIIIDTIHTPVPFPTAYM